MTNLPSGTVTFLFTDIEGSTELAREHPTEWDIAQQRHHAILRKASYAYGGHVFKIIGDAFQVAFSTAEAGLQAAIAAQRTLQSEAWGITPIHVRMGLHTGAAEVIDGEYHGYMTLAQVARIMSTAFGGQTLVSAASYVLLASHLPQDIELRDMGEHRLKGLLNLERLWQVNIPGLLQDFPALRSLITIPNNLPIQVTSFVGREHELVELQQLMLTTRLLTVMGSGGTGKTRLALKLAEHVMASYPDGVWLVELASLSDPAQVPLAILATLGRPDVPAQQATSMLINWLKEKHVLLLIDNCEHVIDACAQVIDALLRSCRNLTVLSTSREALGIPGELSWRVPSLQVPDPQSPFTLEEVIHYESMRLFAERAAFVQPSFALKRDNASAVMHICKRLDGIPLAIELAAARIASFTPEVIAKRLDEGFRLLAGGSRTALPRQQTLQAAIDWSYRLLNEQEKTLLCRLSVFTGGWTLEAGEFVGQDDSIGKDQIFDLLDRLVSKSLVERDDSGIETRYFMLESIRQFALGKLAERDQVIAIRDRHLRYFLELGVEVKKGFEASVQVNQAKLIRRLKPDFNNIRRACDWALDSEKIEAGWSLIESFLGMFVVSNMQMEFIDRLHVMLTHAAAPQNTTRQARLFYLLAEIQNRHGKFDDQLISLKKISDIGHALDNDEILAWSVNGLFENAVARNDLEAAHVHMKRWDELTSNGVYSEIEHVRTHRMMQSILLFMEGDYQKSLDTQKDIYEWYGHSDNKLNTSSIERAYGIQLLYAGCLDQADEHLRVSLIDNHALGDTLAVAACLGSLAALALARNNLSRCKKLLGASEVHQELAGVVLHWFDLSIIHRTISELREQMNESELRKHWTEGRAMTLEQAMAYALETTSI